MESNMELNDDMILVVVDGEESHKEDKISEGRLQVQTLDNNDLVPVKEDPIDLLETVKKKSEDLSQLEYPNKSFVNILKCNDNETFAESIQTVKRRGPMNKSQENPVISNKSLTDNTIQPALQHSCPKMATEIPAISDNIVIPKIESNIQSNPKYTYKTVLANKSTEKGQKEVAEDSVESDDFVAPSSWFRNVRGKTNLKSKRKKENSFDSAVSNNIAHSMKLQKAKKEGNPKLKHKRLEKKSSKKQKLFEDSAVRSDNNISSSIELHKVKTEIDLELTCDVLKRKAIKKQNENISSLSTQYPDAAYSAAEKTESNITKFETIYIKKEKNELVDDTAIKNYFFQFQDCRRSFNPNPKSYVAGLIKNHPHLADDKEALIDALANIMRQVRPPRPPQDYYVMNETSFECRLCGHLSVTIAAAFRHYNEKHGARYLICFACGVNFRSRTNLYKHEKGCIARDADVVLRARARVLGARGRQRPYQQGAPSEASKPKATTPAKREFRCTLCPAKFLTHVWLVAHTNTHRGIRPYVCDVCSLSYTSKITLRKHKTTHTDQQFVCDYCKRSFKLKYNLVAHIFSHTMPYRFLCAECPQRFAHRASLERHRACAHRPRPPPAPAPAPRDTGLCGLCHTRFHTTFKLKKHMLREHGVHIMTRNMFHKKLPSMTETELKETKVISSRDLENVDIEIDMSDRCNLFNASTLNTEDESRDVKVDVSKCGLQNT